MIGAIERVAADLSSKNTVLKEALGVYGDHSDRCRRAATTRCVCGWARTWRELGLRIPDDRQ